MRDMREHNQGAPEQLPVQHRALCEAICARRPEEARTAMHAHIDFVRINVSDPLS